MIIFSVLSAMAVASSPFERVTVTMPAELVAGVDRYERNRSRFITEAVRHELKRRRHLELLRSLDEPHPDSLATAALVLEAWAGALPTEDSDLLDPTAGLPLRLSANQGWQEPVSLTWQEALWCSLTWSQRWAMNNRGLGLVWW